MEAPGPPPPGISIAFLDGLALRDRVCPAISIGRVIVLLSPLLWFKGNSINPQVTRCGFSLMKSRQSALRVNAGISVDLAASRLELNFVESAQATWVIRSAVASKKEYVASFKETPAS